MSPKIVENIVIEETSLTKKDNEKNKDTNILNIKNILKVKERS